MKLEKFTVVGESIGCNIKLVPKVDCYVYNEPTLSLEHLEHEFEEVDIEPCRILEIHFEVQVNGAPGQMFNGDYLFYATVVKPSINEVPKTVQLKYYAKENSNDNGRIVEHQSDKVAELFGTSSEFLFNRNGMLLIGITEELTELLSEIEFKRS